MRNLIFAGALLVLAGCGGQTYDAWSGVGKYGGSRIDAVSVAADVAINAVKALPKPKQPEQPLELKAYDWQEENAKREAELAAQQESAGQ